jgi:hypothetical protein
MERLGLKIMRMWSSERPISETTTIAITETTETLKTGTTIITITVTEIITTITMVEAVTETGGATTEILETTIIITIKTGAKPLFLVT